MTTRHTTVTKSLLWIGGGIVIASAIAWVAARLHAAGVAPLGILPLAVGVALGALLSALARALQFNSLRTLLFGAALLALVTVIAEHAWLYRDFRRQWHQARADEPHIAMFRPAAPWSPKEYFEREFTPHRAVLWAVDAALIIAGAVGAVYVARRVVAEPRTLNPEP